MANDLSEPLAPPPAPPPGPPTPPADEDLGIDREFLVMLARIPLIAVAWTAAAWAASAAVEQFGWQLAYRDAVLNLGPLAVVSFGMLLAAFIDGYAFKVPNWCTLSLVMSGWYIGVLHDCGVTAIPAAIPGAGGLFAALAGTALGFVFLFPILAIGGMGQGDVKMTMGFGSWVCAYFGVDVGPWVLFWSFVLGTLVGGVFGLVMMAMRRQFHKNLSNTREIFRDLQVLVTAGPQTAARRANARRPDWVRLPYGVPLCVGFLGYLWYLFTLAE